MCCIGFLIHTILLAMFIYISIVSFLEHMAKKHNTCLCFYISQPKTKDTIRKKSFGLRSLKPNIATCQMCFEHWTLITTYTQRQCAFKFTVAKHRKAQQTCVYISMCFVCVPKLALAKDNQSNLFVSESEQTSPNVTKKQH